MKTKITLILFSFTLLFSCSKENIETIESSEATTRYAQVTGTSSPDPTTIIYQTDFIAGHNYIAGFITVGIQNNNIVIAYNADENWEIDVTHLYIGDLNGLPINGAGNPRVGSFPYAGVHNGGALFVEYVGPQVQPGDHVYIAAHGDVSNSVLETTETAWGEGEPIGGNSWAMIFDVVIP